MEGLQSTSEPIKKIVPRTRQNDIKLNGILCNTVYVVYLAVILIWRFGEFLLVRQI